MRTKTIVIALFLVLGIIATACSKHSCPAYTQDSAKTTEEVG